MKHEQLPLIFLRQLNGQPESGLGAFGKIHRHKIGF
jgi:hypothetical protein